MARHHTLPGHVTDARSHRPEHAEDIVEIIGRSKQRRAVFEAIYFHKQRVKSVSEIASLTRLTPKQVLTSGNQLQQATLVGQDRKRVGQRNETAYVQDPIIQGMKAKVIRMLDNPRSAKKSPTMRRPQVNVTIKHVGRATSNAKARFLTIDTIESFAKVQGRAPVKKGGAKTMSEKRFKEGIKRILNEDGRFADWGGEQNDVFTTRLMVAGKRRPTAFAFKGPGLAGPLKLRNMGKNGDQLQRLFKSPAQVFIVQHHDQIHEAIIDAMQTYALRRVDDSRSDVWFGTIDGRDSNRLIAAYPECFRKKKKTT